MTKTKKIKFLIVNEFFPPVVFGGGEISMSLLAKKLAQRNKTNQAEVFVLTSHFDGLKKTEISSIISTSNASLDILVSFSGSL